MNSTADAFLRSWPSEPGLWGTLLVAAAVYLRGWRALRRKDPTRWSGAKAWAYLAGLLTIGIALGSPIEPFSGLLLQVHMVQHLLLMMLAPPLLWLGAPFFPLLRGLPAGVRQHWVLPLLRWKSLRRTFAQLTHPLVALAVYVAATWLWHVPAAYELALRSPTWHVVQHGCFLLAAMLFWYPVVRPYPASPRWPLWMLFPYLIVADVQNTILSALFTFSPAPWYPHYEAVPRVGGISALDDQAAAGLVMWIPGSLAFLLPLFGLGVALLGGRATGQPTRNTAAKRGSTLPVVARQPAPPSRGWDLLTVPGVGRVLRSHGARLCLQAALLLAAVAIIVDGFIGPQAAPMNLAGVVLWIHWRGFLILGVLLLGNLFCFACPMVLPRRLLGRWLPQGRRWPQRLRNKWLAAALVLVFLWSYEAFALWDSPWLTAWIAVGYFGAAFTVDTFFRAGTFCKYVCPVGQFNFVQSLASPGQVSVRNPAVCTGCRTHDCLRGTENLPGCELKLYLPRKHDNFDCTFCLDCVRACPHDNVGLFVQAPVASLIEPAAGSLASPSGGASSHLPSLESNGSPVPRVVRADAAALILLLVFGAFANAAAMVAPVVAWERAVESNLGMNARWLSATVFLALALLLIPAILVAAAAAVSRWAGGWKLTTLQTSARFARSLVPLGLGMWLAHYLFHFLTSFDTLWPAAQRFAADLHLVGSGPIDWTLSCCRPASDWIVQLELLLLDLGLITSLYLAWRSAAAETLSRRQTAAAALPWAILMLLLFAVGVWTIFQPMEMRGTLSG